MNDLKVPIVAGILVIIAAVAYVTSGSADALSYRASWGDALEEARESGKPILLYYGGAW